MPKGLGRPKTKNDILQTMDSKYTTRQEAAGVVRAGKTEKHQDNRRKRERVKGENPFANAARRH